MTFLIKNLERTIGKLKNNALNSKAKLDKLQLQVKDQNVETGRKKTTERGTKRKTVKATPPEETVPASIYTKLMKERDEMEARVAKMQTQVKSLELRLSQEREMRTEAEQKAEEVMHEIEEMKGLVKAGKKEHGELSKKHKTELQKVLEELNNVRNNWRSPEELEKCIEEKHNVEIELKQAREEIARKNMVLKQWKEKEDLKQSETEQMLSEIESIKDDSEKLKKALKDLGRKDATIKNQKASLDQLKISEKQLSEENKLLVEKIKTMKAEIGRKDVSLRALREKSDESKIEKEDVKGRDIEIDKFKQKWLAVKQEAERKEEQIKLLRSKLENLMNDLENSKATQDTRNKNDFNEIEKVQKKYEQLRVKLRTTESKLQQMSIMIRTLFREMLTDIEKLRSRSHAVHKGMMQAHKASVSGDSAEYKLYAESLNILGIGEDDMGEFLGGQPRKSPTAIPDYSNDDLVELVAKINRLVESQEKPSDYDEIIEKYKELLKEKTDMEKFLNTLLKEQPSEAKPEERKGVSLDKYERYGRSIEDELAPQKHKSIK